MNYYDASRSPRGNDVPAFPSRAFAITPDDAASQNYAFSVYVGGTGDVAVIPAGGDTAITFAGVPAGTVVPLVVKQVLAAGTTATGLIGLY